MIQAARSSRLIDPAQPEITTASPLLHHFLGTILDFPKRLTPVSLSVTTMAKHSAMSISKMEEQTNGVQAAHRRCGNAHRSQYRQASGTAETAAVLTTPHHTHRLRSFTILDYDWRVTPAWVVRFACQRGTLKRSFVVVAFSSSRRSVLVSVCCWATPSALAPSRRRTAQTAGSSARELSEPLDDLPR